MLYIISGCSSGGKTTITDELALLGYSVSSEPGREVVRQELRCSGSALPWENPVAFSKKCIDLSIQRYKAATQSGQMVFFDRSLIDAVSALMFLEPDCAEPYSNLIGEYPYASTVFMTPPWFELFEVDAERRNTFEDSVAEYERLLVSYSSAGYSILKLPQLPASDRLKFILQHTVQL